MFPPIHDQNELEKQRIKDERSSQYPMFQQSTENCDHHPSTFISLSWLVVIQRLKISNIILPMKSHSLLFARFVLTINDTKKPFAKIQRKVKRTPQINKLN